MKESIDKDETAKKRRFKYIRKRSMMTLPDRSIQAAMAGIIDNERYSYPISKEKFYRVLNRLIKNQTTIKTKNRNEHKI